MEIGFGCVFVLFATPVLMVIGILLALFAGIYQAKLARRLRDYPEDYRRMLVGGKSYLYIESLLSQGVPQAIQEQIKLIRYFKENDYAGKFSERQRKIYLGTLYSAYAILGLFLLSGLSTFICLSGLRS